MLEKINLRVKTLAAVALMVMCSSLGDILLSRGMKQVGAVNLASTGAVGQTFLRILINESVWMGIGLLIFCMVIYMVVLSWADYSFVQPSAAFSYAIVPVLGYLVLGEPVKTVRWAGVLLIVFGVFLISRTSPRTTEPRP
jgi:drug/metabolite transporter (DMT)-like permease